MREVDDEIRSSLERLTDPVGDTPRAEALWGDLVARRRRRRARNGALAALPLLLVAVLGAGVFAAQRPDGDRSDVAAGGAGREAVDEGALSAPSPSATEPVPSRETTSRGRLGDLPVVTSDAAGVSGVDVSLLDGASIRITGPTDLVGELERFHVAARVAMYCQPGCGYAQVAADLRSADLGEGNSGRFVSRSGELSAATGPWFVDVPTANISEADVDGWVKDLAVDRQATSWPRLIAPEEVVMDPLTSSVEFTRGNDAISIGATSCETGTAPTLTRFDDGTEQWSAFVCESQLPVSVSISGSRQFVERASEELTYEGQ